MKIFIKKIKKKLLNFRSSKLKIKKNNNKLSRKFPKNNKPPQYNIE